jgi:hypothetical protein
MMAGLHTFTMQQSIGNILQNMNSSWSAAPLAAAY